MASPTEVAPLQSIQDRVKERIRAQFAELVPDEMWDQLIKKATEDYMRVEFPGQVKELLRAEAERRVREKFQQSQWQAQWDTRTGRDTASEMVERIVREAAPALVQQMFGGMVQAVVDGIRNGAIVPRY